jgi:TRAP transporter TAXI family solute receptor
MRRIIRRTLGAMSACALLAAAPAALAQVVGIATDQQGSLGYNTGQAVAKIANQKAKITARIQPMSGTAAYLPLIDRNEMQFGFCNLVEAEYALTGTGNFEGKKNPNLQLVGVMFPLRTGLMVAADSGIKTIQDLKAKASGLRIASEYTSSTIIKYYIEGALANGGMTYADFKQVPVSGFVKGMEALGDGLVDVTLISLNSAGGKKVNAQLRSRGGIQYVSLDDSAEGEKRFKDFLPAAEIIHMKANPDVPGLIAAANIISIPWVMVTNKDAPDALVYGITKAVVENQKELGDTFGAFKQANVKKMAPASRVAYHPGALKYYKEAGIPVGGK